MKRSLIISLTPVILTACAHSSRPPAGPPAQQLVTTLIGEQIPVIQLAQNELAQVSQVPLSPRPTTSSPSALVAHAAVPGAMPPVAGKHMLPGKTVPAVMQISAPTGHAQSLRQAITRIAPTGWKQWYATGLMPDKSESLNWSGNAPWPEVLDKVLHPLGYVATEDPVAQKISVTRIFGSGLTTSVSRSPFSATPTPSLTQPHPVVTPPHRWNITAGTTLRDALFTWAASAECPGGHNWTVEWMTPVNYRIDAPLAFTGSWHEALNGLFGLYQQASVPLYAGTSTAQCILKVDTRPVR